MQKKDVRVVKATLYGDHKKTEGNGDRHRASVTLHLSNPHTVYIIDKNEAPPEQKDDDLAIIYEEQVVYSDKIRNVGTGRVNFYIRISNYK